MFTALLMQPVANLSAPVVTKEDCDITVGDIIGPLKQEASTSSGATLDRARDANFSLLSYSFSLVRPDSNLESCMVV